MSENIFTHASASRLDVRAFSQAAGTLAGTESLLIYERLAKDISGLAADIAKKSVIWQLQGQAVAEVAGPAQMWLHLQVQAQLPMICQRCLTAVDIPVDIDGHYRFVADEATALAEDEVSEEDVLVLSKQFDVHALIEDELLMALPIVPKHGVCPLPVKLASTDDDFKAALTQKPNAFAALGSLKKPEAP